MPLEWPNGSTLAVSITLMCEGGGEVWPEATEYSPLGGVPLEGDVRDYPSETYYQYGPETGIPALLDVFDRHDIPITAFAVGKAVENYPDLFARIVDAGHEIAGHGYEWVDQTPMSKSEEDEFIARSVQAIEDATGTQPKGWNCFALRRSPETLNLLQKHRFNYHIDDVSRDEPFVIEVNEDPFAVVPYSLHLNDLVLYEFQGHSTVDWLDLAKREFEALLRSSRSERKHMTIPCHDRVMGRAARREALDEFLDYATGHDSVWFAKREELADVVLQEHDE